LCSPELSELDALGDRGDGEEATLFAVRCVWWWGFDGFDGQCDKPVLVVGIQRADTGFLAWRTYRPIRRRRPEGGRADAVADSSLDSGDLLRWTRFA
jgi:hypothetical protein